jgi:hypothetical protein
MRHHPTVDQSLLDAGSAPAVPRGGLAGCGGGA